MYEKIFLIAIKNSFNYQIDCAKGKLQNFPKLPLPLCWCLMVTSIKETGRTYNRNLQYVYIFKITPDKWFFPCHFEDDPVVWMLEMDALWPNY